MDGTMEDKLSVIGNITTDSGWLHCEALLSTKSETDKNVSDIISPVDDAIAHFFNEGQEEEKMWVHSQASMRISSIKTHYRALEGYTRAEDHGGDGFTFHCSIEEMRIAIANAERES